eukprot:3096942-Karenia_brevis.AAC.1
MLEHTCDDVPQGDNDADDNGDNDNDGRLSFIAIRAASRMSFIAAQRIASTVSFLGMPMPYKVHVCFPRTFTGGLTVT